MRILRTSALTGEIHQMDLNVTKDQLLQWIIKKELAQRVFLTLNSDQREFLITGITPDEGVLWYAVTELISLYVPHTDAEEGIISVPPEDLNEILHLIELYQPV